MTQLCIGIDIGGTNTVFAAIDKMGNTAAQAHIPTVGAATIEEYCDDLTTAIRELIHGLEDRPEILAIGVGAPNGNYYKGTVEFAPNLPWTHVLPLCELLHARISLPVYLTNDANAAAIGEGLFGAAKGLKDYIVVTLGTGLGSGIVVQGQVVYGSTGFGGELGHVIVEQGGRDCGCGRKGCLERYASVTGLVHTLREKIAESDAPSGLRFVPVSELEGSAIADAAKAGDEFALATFEDLSATLGLALANAVAITSPEAIFLFGGLAKAGDLLLEPTRRHMEAQLLDVFKGTVRLELSALLDSNAGMLGAAALAWNEISAPNAPKA